MADKQRVNLYVKKDLYNLFMAMVPRRDGSSVTEELMEQWCRDRIAESGLNSLSAEARDLAAALGIDS